jgi:hypothetical protein
MQTSTCGFFGIYDFSSEIFAKLEAARLAGTWFPTRIAATYMALQGERSVVSQIQLGGKGKYANGNDARYFINSAGVAAGPGGGVPSFVAVDGFEWIAAAGTTNGYVIIQEDGGNRMGERTFIAKVRTDGTPLTYYFIAFAGGQFNTRNSARVGVPALTNTGSPTAHEFSGLIDLSGMLARDASGNWIATAGVGATKRVAERMVPINNKTIAMGLQSHNLVGGIINAMAGDRGGQVYAYKPQLPLIDA